MALCGYLKAGTSVAISLGPFLDDDDALTEKTGLTIQDTTVYLSKNGGAKANPNDTNDCTEDANGVYLKSLDSTDTNTCGILTVYVHESDALYIRQDYMVVNANVFDSLYAAAATDYLQVDAVQFSSSTTAANNAEIVFDTDFATNYSTGNDKWQVESDCLSVSGSTTAANNLEVVFDTDFATNYSAANDKWQVESDCLAISGDSTAADNLELDYDGTGYTKANSTVGTCTTNTDMRGTDSAALASGVDVTSIHGSALSETSAGNIADNFSTFWDDGDSQASTAKYSDIASILTDSNELQTDWVNGGRLDLLIDAIKAVTDDMKHFDDTIASIDTADTVFRLTNGLTANDDVNNAVVSIYDVTGSVWSGPRRITDYVHATKQITIDADTPFALQASDRVVIWNVSYATTAAGGSISAGDIADIADAVHDETMSDHLTEGTTGAKLNASDKVGR